MLARGRTALTFTQKFTALLALLLLASENPGAGLFVVTLAQAIGMLPTEILPQSTIANFGSNFASFNTTLSAGFELAYPNITGLHIPARDITHYSSICQRKVPAQGGGISKGRKCVIGNKMYFMKYDLNNDRILEYYNLMLTQTLGIQIPKVEFILNKKEIKGSLGKLLIASESISGYTSGFDLKQSLTQTSFRKFVSLKIGEEGISRLTVAQGFIADLYTGNWGSNANNQLILMDVDGGLDKAGNSRQPTTLSGYLTLATAIRFNKKNNLEENTDQLTLSLNNIELMKEIYQSLLGKSTPKLYKGVDMSDEFFHALLNIYIRACDITLTNLGSQFPVTKPTSEVNDELAKAIKSLATEIIPIRDYSQFDTDINIAIPGMIVKPVESTPTINDYLDEYNGKTTDIKPPVTDLANPTTFNRYKPIPAIITPSVEVMAGVTLFGLASIVGLFAKKRSQAAIKKANQQTSTMRVITVPKVKRRGTFTV